MIRKIKRLRVQKMYYKRKTNCKDYKSCLNPSKIENKINILKDDNYNDDKWLKNIVNF